MDGVTNLIREFSSDFNDIKAGHRAAILFNRRFYLKDWRIKHAGT